MRGTQPRVHDQEGLESMSKKSTSEKSTFERLIRTALFASVRGAAYTAGAVMVTATVWWLQGL